MYNSRAWICHGRRKQPNGGGYLYPLFRTPLAHHFPKQLLPDPRHGADQAPLGLPVLQVGGCPPHHQAAQAPVIGIQPARLHNRLADLGRGERAHGRSEGFEDHAPGVALSVVKHLGDLAGRQGGKINVRVEQPEAGLDMV